jgi:hypothetical protein
METIAALQELSHSKSGKGELATRASRYWAGERFVGSSLEYCQWQAATTMSEIRNLFTFGKLHTSIEKGPLTWKERIYWFVVWISLESKQFKFT